MYYILTLILGFLIGYFVASKKQTVGFMSRQQETKEKNKQAIYDLLETNSPLTNNDVQKMLGISDATATRYFDELEQEGKVKQVGKTGRHVHYERV